ncbi:uncharacterized protein ASPGLDRAFT_1005919 [Aspergillus glaucus CBS 516.65]|uniref:Uncharacterized protein n=1 Tax=Aspergillus glaucus CBS 516.65 TaxID=1160497 RepID=A0A1L9VVI3_ASPGL|nr:hypothetical protein ASPGLDRAFT_1005919 [Aspergillus glaucus CBS 516.65]OJJ87915.1 hypothetical protein ASPGLDRAFT_1005919 [Aspergillus glaucus CBS 516.65]
MPRLHMEPSRLLFPPPLQIKLSVNYSTSNLSLTHRQSLKQNGLGSSVSALLIIPPISVSCLVVLARKSLLRFSRSFPRKLAPARELRTNQGKAIAGQSEC